MAAYQKILAAVDRSPRSQAVFDHAITLAKMQDAKLMLIHCLTFPQTNQDFGDRYNANLGQFLSLAQAQIDAKMEETRKWMTSLCNEATESGVVADWDWRIGEAGPQLCAAAKDWDADLIVVGRRGHQGLKEIFLGSVSNYVLHRAKCSVMVVQSEQ